MPLAEYVFYLFVSDECKRRGTIKSFVSAHAGSANGGANFFVDEALVGLCAPGEIIMAGLRLHGSAEKGRPKKKWSAIKKKLFDPMFICISFSSMA